MPSTADRHHTLFQTYGERSERPNLTPLSTYLLRLIHIKQTNLCVSADVTSSSELLRLAEDVGDHICVLKTHADMIKGFGDKTIRGLEEIARRKRFLVFEDRKFMDIGNTVQEQYAGGDHQIVRWAPIVNAALFSGPSVIPALARAAQKAIAAYNSSVQTDISASPAPSLVDSGNDDVESLSAHELDGSEDPGSDSEEEEPTDERKGRKHSVVSVSTTISTKTEAISPQPTLKASLSRASTEEEEDDSDNPDSDSDSPEATLADLGPPPYFRALLLLAQMSSAGNHFSPAYTQECLHQARRHKDFVMGFIAQQSLNADPDDNFLTLTPGVQLSAGGDALGQQYNTPRKVIGDAGSDVIIVGRGILAAPDRRRAALEYRRQGWAAYEERLRSGRRR